MNSDDFDYPCSWFEDSKGNRSTLMANRTVAAKYIPTNAQRLRIEKSIWVHGDDWIHYNIHDIYKKLSSNPEYVVRIIEDTLFVELAAEGTA